MKKTYIIILSVLGLFITVTGLTYAFFLVTNNNTAMETDVTAALLGEVDFVHGPSVVQPPDGIYPGWIGVQEFSINKPAGMNAGIGAFEVIMETTIDPAYNDWISIEVYKTTDMGNTITRVEGTITNNPDNSNQVYVTDSLTTNGFTIPDDSIKTQVINSTSGDVSLDKQNFDLATYVNTKYYVVYRYANANESQNGAMGKEFNTVIKVNAIKRFTEDAGGNDYEDPTIAGGDPVIPESDLPSDYKWLPVTIATDGTVTIADTTKQWYDYENSEWANSVIADVSTLSTNPGTEIPMSEIEQMYVWIPRYEYSKSSITSAQESIEINFVPISIVNTDIENNDVIVHPAFTFGGEELAGLWVGKFELGWQDDFVVSDSYPDYNNDIETTYIIKPNVNSVHATDISTMFNNIQETKTTYSMDATTDVHMMKNTEWGAVAYLSQSKYGICEDDVTCSVKIEKNNYYNSSTYDIVTGCGGNDTAQNVSVSGINICPASNRWETTNGIKASTTHNITGIYDMAGGRDEYVMGNMQDSSGNFYPRSSGFTTAPDAKYYDSYANGSSSTDYTRGLYGDATVELNPSGNGMSNWNSDAAYFVNSSKSWLLRGGQANSDANAGVFGFGSSYGYVSPNYSARLVLLFAAP